MARLSVGDYGRALSLALARGARHSFARLSWYASALLRLWPGRTDRLVIAPQDLRTADATRAAEIYAGRFVFAGKIVTCHGRSPFDIVPPSPEWDAALLGFGWLRHLRAADSPITRANARALIEEWINNGGKTSPRAWRTDVLSRRILSLISQAPLVLTDSDARFYRRYLRSLSREIRYLRFMILDAADGTPRLQALMALCFAALCLANQSRHIKSATRKLADELQRQILPDGGHISRSPLSTIELLLDLLPLRQTFAARNIAPPSALLNAIDRMMPMLRFFRHPDGNFALFNGMGATPSDLVATLLAYDDTQGVPMSSLPHSGFQRLDAGSTSIIMDSGAPPPSNISQDAHAGTLSFELSSGLCRIVINCGMPANGREEWRAFARSTPAHSTMTYHETSSSEFVGPGAMKRLLQGSPIVSGPEKVEAFRETISTGTLLTTSHDGYARRFGIGHRRVLMLSQDGSRLDGEDMIERFTEVRQRQANDDFAIRFHLHPQIKASRLRDGRGVMLVLPNREVWTFEALDDTVELEDSVFLAGSDGPRRSAQIVIRQQARQASTVRWAFTRSNGTGSQSRRNQRYEPELPL